MFSPRMLYFIKKCPPFILCIYYTTFPSIFPAKTNNKLIKCPCNFFIQSANVRQWLDRGFSIIFNVLYQSGRHLIFCRFLFLNTLFSGSLFPDECQLNRITPPPHFYLSRLPPAAYPRINVRAYTAGHSCFFKTKAACLSVMPVV